MALADRLKEARRRKGWTQEYVAELLHVDRTAYGRYETGKSDLTAQQLQTVAALFEVSPAWLLEWDGPPSAGPTSPSAGAPDDPWHDLLGALQRTTEELRETARRHNDLEEKRLAVEAIARRAEADRAAAEKQLGEAANKAQDNFRFLAEHWVADLSHATGSSDEAEVSGR